MNKILILPKKTKEKGQLGGGPRDRLEVVTSEHVTEATTPTSSPS